MPFTLSHAAAAWPFRKTRLDFSALLTGCFIPDAPYFLFFIPHGFKGHTLRGMFEFDLPAALVALWLFHTLIQPVLSIFLPQGVRKRMTADGNKFSFMPISHLALIMLSILLGAATHIFWDSFTHQYRWGYRHWSFLRLGVSLPVVGNMEMYKLLQYGSSVAGLVFIAIWIWHWYRTTRPAGKAAPEPFTQSRRRLLAFAMPTAAICGGLWRAYELVKIPDTIKPTVHFTVDALVTAITVFGAELLVCGLMLRWIHARSRRFSTNYL